MAITEGLTGGTGLRVGTADTALALGSGDVAVLGTPRVLALAEAATIAALDGHLEEGRTTVGTRIDLAHTAATPVGAAVRATAVLREVDAKRLVFDVTVARDGSGPAPGGTVARGIVERVVVDRARFLANAGA